MRVIAEALPSSRQTLLFSATMTASLVAMQKHALQNAFHFQVRCCWCTIGPGLGQVSDQLLIA